MFPTLSDEQRQFIATIRQLAQGEFRERAPRYQDGTFPWENLKALAELGVLGMAVPEEYGGLGLPVFDTTMSATRCGSTGSKP
jgi:alkylation response protein AidB-like acyl-CoA dehydrogenase